MKLEYDKEVDAAYIYLEFSIKEGEVKRYRLTPKGINLAISIINLEHTEKIIEYSKQMRKFTITIIIIGSLAFLVGLAQLILMVSKSANNIMKKEINTFCAISFFFVQF